MVWMDPGDPKESLEPPETMAILATMACRVTKGTLDRLETLGRRVTREWKGTPDPLAPWDPRALMANLEFLEVLASQVELGKMVVLDHGDLMVSLA